jgi:hypothetical protein
MPRKYVGITAEKAFYSTRDWLDANKRSILDLEPDIYWPASAAYPGRALEAAKISQVKWPGPGGLAEDSGIQFVEAEYMKADEYDLFLDDPTDYYIRTYLPRLFKSCESLKELPPIKALFYGGYRAIFSSAVLAEPAIVEAIEALYRTALESKAFVHEIAAFNREMTELGFPPAFGGAIAGAPFDVLSDVHSPQHIHHQVRCKLSGRRAIGDATMHDDFRGREKKGYGGLCACAGEVFVHDCQGEKGL